MLWQIRYHNESVQTAVLTLPPGLLARYLLCTDRMLEFGPDLGMPHTRAMGASLFELRLKSSEGIGRVFLLHLGGTKNHHASSIREEDKQNPAGRAKDCAPAPEGVEKC